MSTILAQTVGLPEIIIVVLYLMLVGYLGWLGYRRTKSASDYLIAGRKIHPFVMAMSYGATFISTSAIVGFGGVAGWFGMSLLWLTFLNIFVGIFVAFAFLGGPTRRMGHRLDAHTFPELLGRRFDSKFIQVFGGLVIFVFIPLYASAVLIGGCEFIATQFKIDYNVALLVFSVIIAAYVVVGGLKGVMYTDALQGSIMFVGMLVLLIATYVLVGGVGQGHQDLADMAGKAFAGFKGIGHKGWMQMPTFGWGDAKYDLWWIVVSTIVMGVGIGVLAQPQLAVRFMTVKSKRELNRAMLVGGIFILVMTGVAFTVGSVSNVYFYKHEVIHDAAVVGISENEGVIAKKEAWVEKRVPCKLWHLDVNGDGEADTHIVAEGVGEVPAKIMPKAEYKKLPGSSEGDEVRVGDHVEVWPRATAHSRALVKTSGGWMFNTDSVIPTFISSAMPKWFGLLFLLTLLAAAMSTLSSQFHTLGTSIGRDVYEQCAAKSASADPKRGIMVVRVGIIIGIIIAVVLSHYARGGYFIARATAIFFGLCASAFLPAFVGGLFCRRITKPAAIASMLVGFLVTAFWLLLVKEKEAGSIGLVMKLTGGKPSILDGHPNWPNLDPLFVALPLSILTVIVVSLFTRPPGEAHLAKCFPARGGNR